MPVTQILALIAGALLLLSLFPPGRDYPLHSVAGLLAIAVVLGGR